MVLVSIACPICGSDSFKVIRESKWPIVVDASHFEHVYRSSSEQQLFEQVVRCDSCGLVYLNPRPKDEIILASYRDVQDTSFIKQNEERIKTFKVAFSKVIGDFKLPSGSRVLDIGCAGGAFLKAAKDLGMSPVGIEPSKYLTEFSKSTYRVEVLNGLLEEQSLPEQSFDVITLWDVIEHLLNPEQTFKIVSRLIKPNGILVINYPNFKSRLARLMGDKWPFWLSVHVTYFEPRTLEAFLNKFGFQIQDQRRHWQILQLGYLLERAGAYFKVFGYLSKVTYTLGLSRIPLFYYMGQHRVVAKKI